MDLLPQGLLISAVGLVTAFAAMTSFILVIVVLQRIFPAKKNGGEPMVETAGDVENEMTAGGTEAEDGAVVAAIAAALAVARSRAQNTLGAELGAGRGSWWNTHLLNARQGRTIKN